MSASETEPTVRDRLAEWPSLSLGRLRDVRPRDLGIRFLAGAVTSIAAGLIALAFGDRVGGTLLAFPAVLAASLTLIKQEEDAADAREDSRGATVGGFALMVFAAVGTVALRAMGPVLALGLATAAWLVAAGGGYALLWGRRKR